MAKSSGVRLHPPNPASGAVQPRRSGSLQPGRSGALQPRQSISGQIADRLREEILSAAIGPDQPLRQDHIARRFEVSQAPVREALKQLASERLVIAQLNRGVRVAPLDRNEVEETAALRLKLELDLIESAAGNFRTSDAERANEALDEISGATSVLELMRANDNFHEIIYRPAKKPVTVEVVRELRARYARYLGFMWQHSGHAQVSLVEHRDLLDRLRRGRAQEAGELLRKHIKASTDAILEALRRHDR